MTSMPMQPNCLDRILVASPNVHLRKRVLDSLRSPSLRCQQANGGAEALSQLENGSWQVLFLDRLLPDLDAEELSQTVRRRFPEVRVVLLDREFDPGFAKGATALEAKPHQSEHGMSKPHSSELDSPILAEKVDGAPEDEGPLPGMIGNSRVMQPVYRMARLLAPRNTSVLITGPSGCGKDVLARAIHQLSTRAARSFAVVNCAAIPETMLEAELFGYARGAFTGALQSYAGKIQSAQGGTLFLDEIGDMPLSLQPKLLRFLEQKELQRLGSNELVRIDARVISATNAHLFSLVREGKFREDLYYRLCGFPLDVPPLRERPDDIAALVSHFLEKFAAQSPVPTVSLAALEQFKAHAWPGNIRELQNVIERALILSEDDGIIRPEHLLLEQ